MIPKHRGKIAVKAALKAVGNVDVKSQRTQVRDFHKFKLKNGLTVLLKESHKSPVVSVQMWVRTGSADERKGEEGISHFIEHLVFKGTEKFGVGEIASLVEASGGEINAYTTFDQTVFYVTISKEFSTTAMDVIAQMMGFPKFDAGEIDNEREVVVEEIKRGADSLSRQSSQLLFSNTFRKHPYGLPVIGYEKVVRSVSRKKLNDYFCSRYNPENMFLVVAGDINDKTIKQDLEKYFGTIAKNKLRRVKRAKEPKTTSPKFAVRSSTFNESQLYISWKTPGALHADVPALDVLALILGQGESSRLFQRLRLKKHLANSAYATCFTPNDLGLFAVSVSLNKQNFGDVLAELKDFWVELFSSLVTEEELRKAIANFRAEQFYSLETVDGLARRLGSTYLLAKDPKFLDEYLKRVEKLTPIDLYKVARKYLQPQHMHFSMLVDESPKTFEAKSKRWLKDTHKALKSLKFKPKAQKRTIKKPTKRTHKTKLNGELLKETLPGGGVLLIRPNYDTPVVSVRAGFLGGLRIEPKDRLGVTELLSRTWTCGTQNLSEEQVAEQIDSMASSLSAFGGRNTMGLSMETLDIYQKSMLDLLQEIWTKPLLSDYALDRERAHMIELHKTRKDNPAQVCSLLFLHNLFGTHPYGLDMMGTPESLSKITTQDLRGQWQKPQTQGNLVISASGAVDVDLLREKLSAIAYGLPQGDRINQTVPCEPLNKNHKVYESADKQQTHIIYGFRGLTFTSPERFALQVMQSVLAGQGGRLFVELRDKASLAYSVAPMRMEGIETGYFGAYIGCSPEKGKQAIAMIETEFEKLKHHPITKAELARAQRYLIGRHDIDLQRNSAIAGGLLFDELYGVGTKEIFKYTEMIRAVTAESVLQLARRIFSSPAIVSAVGPSRPFD